MKRNHIILHIDDDPSMLRLVSKKLGGKDYEVVSLDDPTQTLEKLIETGARVVLLDINMPQINGLTLLKELKKQDGGVQVIMLTGMVSISTALQSMRWGAEACVFKPLTDFGPLQTAVQASFDKIERWWRALDDLNQRRSKEQKAVESATL